MKKIIMLFIMLCFALLVSCSNKQEVIKTSFTNPVMPGWYPDPSICQTEDAYYLVNSTFAFFPGIPIHKSKNLVDWEQIGNVIDRPEQLQLEGFGVSRAIFAPAIKYHNGTFYVTCTVVDGGGNFVVTATNPAGPWSNPVYLPHVNGIDPSLFFDDDGKTYIIYNSDAPDYKPEYPGHRTIRANEFDLKTLTTSEENIILLNKGVRPEEKPIWIEGPHIKKINGTYYLMAAEGGTSINHSEVILRSDKAMGPYVPYKNNPILTHRDLPDDRPNPITCVGHADIVENFDGTWWACFLGCRPYKEGHYNNGRETFLTPVKWVDGWPIINPDFDEVQYSYDINVQKRYDTHKYSGNVTFRDDFKDSKIGLSWLFLRTPNEKWYDIDTINGGITLELRPETCRGKKNPSFIGHRQSHLKGEAISEMTFKANSSNEKAGLLVFQNEFYYYFLSVSISNEKPVLELWKSDPSRTEVGNDELLKDIKLDKSFGDNIYLKVTANYDKYSFFYSKDGNEWQSIMNNVDATYLSTETAGGFVGVNYSLYATSNGKESNNKVTFNFFEATNDDDIYKKQTNN